LQGLFYITFNNNLKQKRKKMTKQTYITTAKQIIADTMNRFNNTTNITEKMVKPKFTQTSPTNGEYRDDAFSVSLMAIETYVKGKNITLTHNPIKKVATAK
jgi:hypothetical protein